MKWRWFYITPIFLFFIVSYSFFTKWAKVDHISFSAKSFWIQPEQKKQLIQDLNKKIQVYLGAWVWDLPIKKLDQLIRTHPKVEEVKIFRSWPNRFVVHLSSDSPVLVLLGDRFFHPITKKGKLLNPITIADIPDIPILRGKVFFEQLLYRQKAVRLFQHLPKKGLLSQSNLSEIKYSTKDSGFYLYLIRTATPIRVGENLPEFRPDRVESVLKYLKQKKIKWRVIDARFSQKVVVSLAKGS